MTNDVVELLMLKWLASRRSTSAATDGATLGRPVRLHAHAEHMERGYHHVVVIRCQRCELEGIITCELCERPGAAPCQLNYEAPPQRLRQSVLVPHGRVVGREAAELKLLDISLNATLVETRDVPEA